MTFSVLPLVSSWAVTASLVLCLLSIAKAVELQLKKVAMFCVGQSRGGHRAGQGQRMPSTITTMRQSGGGESILPSCAQKRTRIQSNRGLGHSRQSSRRENTLGKLKRSREEGNAIGAQGERDTMKRDQRKRCPCDLKTTSWRLVRAKAGIDNQRQGSLAMMCLSDKPRTGWTYCLWN